MRAERFTRIPHGLMGLCCWPLQLDVAVGAVPLSSPLFAKQSLPEEQNMKFAGLILICASSSLALLLPALGVVKFPLQSNPSSSNASWTTSAQASPPGAAVSSDPQGILAGSLLGSNLPPPIGNLQSGSSTPSTNLGANTDPSSSMDPPSIGLGKIPFTQIASQKLGLGVWLSLGPVILLGLGIWTLAPAPRKLK
jgi:hypothetical protein